MRSSLALLIALSLTSCGSRQVKLTTLCIDRPEQNGRLNITPVSVTLIPKRDGNPVKLELPTGGTRACAKVPIGQATLALRFPYPYWGPGEEAVDYWESKSVITASDGSNAFILDTARTLDTNAPGWSETGWHSMWEVRKQ